MMEECQYSNIAIMQLFHELKQQFPTLPDHIVSRCIAQNNHDRDTCAESLRITQQSRLFRGELPRSVPGSGQPLRDDMNISSNGNTDVGKNSSDQSYTKAQRRISLGNTTLHQSITPNGARVALLLSPIISASSPPEAVSTSAPDTVRNSAQELSDSRNRNVTASIDNCTHNDFEGINSGTTGLELNVDVACNPANNSNFRTIQTPELKQSNLSIESRSHQQSVAIRSESRHTRNTRSYTSVKFCLRPPSSEPQHPINIESQTPNLNYSASPLPPQGFQSQLQISIGTSNPANPAARIKPQMGYARANPLVSTVQSDPQRLPGLLPRPPSQLPRPTITMNATTSTTPSTLDLSTPSSLPVNYCSSSIVSPSSSHTIVPDLTQVTEQQKKLICEQLRKKEKLANELRTEKARLETMKRELQTLLRPVKRSVSPQELKRKLRSEIYQLQLECDRLADEVDQSSDPRVPLGETNEEFYHGIYTGQPMTFPVHSSRLPPPLPSVPPAWEPQTSQARPSRDDREGPSWVCRMCTFDNHPLMDKCEQCDMPKFAVHTAGETQDIRIRITHHHNFSPGRRVHSWVV